MGWKTLPISKRATSRRAAVEVPRRRLEETGEQRGAQQALLLAERVGHPDRRSSRVVGGEAQQIELAGTEEAHRLSLEVARSDHRLAHRTLGALLGARPCRRAPSSRGTGNGHIRGAWPPPRRGRPAWSHRAAASGRAPRDAHSPESPPRIRAWSADRRRLVPRDRGRASAPPRPSGARCVAARSGIG